MLHRNIIRAHAMNEPTKTCTRIESSSHYRQRAYNFVHIHAEFNKATMAVSTAASFRYTPPYSFQREFLEIQIEMKLPDRNSLYDAKNTVERMHKCKREEGNLGAGEFTSLVLQCMKNITVWERCCTRRWTCVQVWSSRCATSVTIRAWQVLRSQG